MVTGEIGDSWIHGPGCDPEKVRQYRHLLRLCRDLPREQAEPVYRELLVPEHTWGPDEKVHLGDWWHTFSGEHRYFIRSEFEAARPTERFRKMEQSWQEQRDYVRRGAAAYETITGKPGLLPAPAFPDLTGWEEVSGPVPLGDYTLAFSDTGAVCRLEKNGRVLTDEAHPLGQLLYETFSAEDVRRFKEDYLIAKEDWTMEDFGKIGMEKAGVESAICRPVLEKLLKMGSRLLPVPPAFLRLTLHFPGGCGIFYVL